MKKILKALISIIIVTSVLLLVIRIFDLQLVRVNGHSMYPTLIENDFVLSTRYTKLQYGDIVMFKHKDTNLIKRIIGVPGDTISIDENGIVKINNVELKEDYIRKHVDTYKNEREYPITLEDGEYFVLGDNRDDSLDSRLIIVGNVKEEEIIGKIKLSIIPFEKLK